MSKALDASSDLENCLKGGNAESCGKAIDEAFPIEKKPWSELSGLLSGEEGEEFARIIEEAFPTEPTASQLDFTPGESHERDRADD